jgi:hypothetical protein
MTKKDELTVKWKLAEKPTADNLTKLLEAGVLTKEEVRKITIEDSVVTQSDIEAIKSEMKLMRDLILELSNRQPQYINLIQQRLPQGNIQWVHPWINYCNGKVNLLA